MLKLLPNFKRMLALAPLALAIGFCAGCWEEVHYTGTTAPPKQKDKPRADAPIASSGPAVGAEAFGDELAQALTERSRQQHTPIAQPPTTDTLPNPIPTTGTRYGEPPASNIASTPPTVPGETKMGNAGLDTSLFPMTRKTNPTLPATTIDPTQTSTPPRTGQTTDTIATQLPDVTPSNPIPTATSTSPAATQPAVAAVTPETERARTRRAAWLLGSRWSLAALARERGAADKDVAEWVTVAQTQAASLGTTLNEMPPLAPADAPKSKSSATVNYLIADGQRLGREITAKYGADHAALLELAVKSNLLLVLYEPGSQAANTLSDVILKARERAGLPVELTRPLLSAIVEMRPVAAVRQAVFRLHDDLDRQLDPTLLR